MVLCDSCQKRVSSTENAALQLIMCSTPKQHLLSVLLLHFRGCAGIEELVTHRKSRTLDAFQFSMHTCMPCHISHVLCRCLSTQVDCSGMQARQQVQEMVWMKQSENMVLEAMTRLSTVHDALEELLSGTAQIQPYGSHMASG